MRNRYIYIVIYMAIMIFAFSNLSSKSSNHEETNYINTYLILKDMNDKYSNYNKIDMNWSSKYVRYDNIKKSYSMRYSNSFDYDYKYEFSKSYDMSEYDYIEDIFIYGKRSSIYKDENRLKLHIEDKDINHVLTFMEENKDSVISNIKFSNDNIFEDLMSYGIDISKIEFMDLDESKYSLEYVDIEISDNPSIMIYYIDNDNNYVIHDIRLDNYYNTSIGDYKVHKWYNDFNNYIYYQNLSFKEEIKNK